MTCSLMTIDNEGYAVDRQPFTRGQLTTQSIFDSDRCLNSGKHSVCAYVLYLATD